ncbi:MAG: tRNA (guanine(26)-N(2))-dimethyltransferase [Candidatus Nanoarchaeia archaeon]|jgi:tRNA (guanine26-N2/guanine27-N2)-dimethyltransferase
MLSIYTEGKAKFYASPWQEESAKTPVFYNPVMKLNRDVAVWIIKMLKPKSLCFGMEASGVRAIRCAVEANATNIIANDIGKDAFEAMQKNIELNNVQNQVKAENKDVKELLSQGAFDYIDIDPFGTPVYFAGHAIRALSSNGILAVTATDTSCLCGRFVKACIRKYSSRPLNNEFNKETGIRILVWKMQQVAEQQGKCLIPIFVHSSDHYLRAYLQSVNESGLGGMHKQQGFILYCPKCLNRFTSESSSCVCCGKPMEHAGPLWLGNLWDEELVREFDLIPYIQQESRINVPWHFDTHRISKAYGKTSVRHEHILTFLQTKGFKASRTHFKPEGIKTDAEIKDLVALF